MGACCCSLQSSRRAHIVSAYGFGTTEPLLKETEREAVNAILKFLDSDSSPAARRLSTDRLESLRTLAYSDNVELQKSAALCYSELSENWSDPVTIQFLEPIIQLLLSPDIGIQKASSLAISNLALKGPVENKNTIVRAGALSSLIILLNSQDPEVQCNTCGCITTLATTESNKREIVVQGAIPPLLKLAHVRDPKVQRNAAGALLNLTHVESNRQDLVQSGAVAVFIKLLESQDIDVQFYCAAALSNIAVSGEHRQVIIRYSDGKVIKVLISLMKSLSEKVCCQACLAIRNLASDEENQDKIVECGGLDALVPLLWSGDTDTVTAAVAALRNLSIMKGNEIHIVKSGALVELSRLLSLQEQSEIQCHAAGTIRNLAAEEQHVAIIEAGCLTALAERLRDSKHVPGDVLSEISAAMGVLVSNSIARKQLMSLYNGDFHKVLLKLTDSPHREVQYNCAGIIGHLAMNEEYHSVLLNEEPSAIDCMLKLLDQNDSSFIHLALWVIAQFSNGSKSTRALLRKSVLIDKIIELKSKKYNTEISQLAESAYNNLQAQ